MSDLGNIVSEPVQFRAMQPSQIFDEGFVYGY